MRAAWAAHRAEASEGGGDIGAWRDGDAARAVAWRDTAWRAARVSCTTTLSW